MNGRARHVIFGAGQIGTPLAIVLAARGHEVVQVRRGAGEAPRGTTRVTGDAGDPDFATEVTRGARVLYHCMNPPYDAAVWERELPRLMTSLMVAAGRAGARLVVLDNLYSLGLGSGGPLDEDTPVAPVSRKGAIRARVAERLFAAHARGDLRAVIGRASDFYGPGGVATFFGDAFWPRVLAGKSAQVLSDPDQPHAFHYTLDVAEGLATLGEAPDDVTGRWWMLPAAPAGTSREMIARFAAALGREIAIERVPALLLRALGLVNPLLREVGEMRYEWDRPFLVNDARFRGRFAVAATPIDAGSSATAEWARTHYARSA